MMPMTFHAVYPGGTRATETDFEEGDRIGIFVCHDSLPLQVSGNVVNNEMLTLSHGSWTPRNMLYWNDGTYNVSAYYPYLDNITSIGSQPFAVSTDQSEGDSATAMSSYEASDLLFASARSVTASIKPVTLQFSHVMSRMKIRLIKGEDYEGELPATAKVYVHNTVTNARININDGTVTKDENGKRQTITAHKDGDNTYSAIIVPQSVTSRIPLIEVEIDGVSYVFESSFTFRAGMQHTVNFIISGNPEQMKIDIGGESANWE